MSTVGLDQKDRLTRQKQLLNKRLGLDVAGGLGIQSEELFREEDLLVAQPAYHADRDRQQVSLSRCNFQCFGTKNVTIGQGQGKVNIRSKI